MHVKVIRSDNDSNQPVNRNKVTSARQEYNCEQNFLGNGRKCSAVVQRWYPEDREPKVQKPQRSRYSERYSMARGLRNEKQSCANFLRFFYP